MIEDAERQTRAARNCGCVWLSITPGAHAIVEAASRTQGQSAEACRNSWDPTSTSDSHQRRAALERFLVESAYAEIVFTTMWPEFGARIWPTQRRVHRHRRFELSRAAVPVLHKLVARMLPSSHAEERPDASSKIDEFVETLKSKNPR
jgi:hypothetical protein